MADHLKNKKQVEENEQGQGQTMEDHLKRREENEVDEAKAENKTPREENEKEDGAAEKKRPREEDEATAEKKQREETEENLMSWREPDIAANGTSASPTTSVDLHNEFQPQQKEEEVRGNSSSINLFHVLRDRQLGEYDIKKLPNILPNIIGDYHLQAFHIGMTYVDTQLVMADDTICVIHHINYDKTCIVPVRRQVDPFQMSVFTDDDNTPIMNLLPWFENIYYNPHNNSLIMMSRPDTETRHRSFISIDMPSIKAGLTTSYKHLFQDESILIYDSDVDIRNCRCMIYNLLEKVFMFYELREYSLLFTIPEPSSSLQYQIQATVNINYGGPEVPGFTFGSPENMEMLIHQRIFEESILFRIYCKRNGKIRKEFFLPLEVEVVQARRFMFVPLIVFVLLCGSDRMVVQLKGRPLDVVDISCENPVYIKRTNIRATYPPYYLSKSSKFICYDSTIHKVRVCNLEGEILATLHDHPVDIISSFSYGSHITKSEDIIISVCLTGQYLHSINVSSILTGQCLAKISPHTANCSRIRQAAFAFPMQGFAYDERTHEIFTTNNRGICCVWSNRFRHDVGNIDDDELSDSTDDELSDSTDDDEPSGGEESDNS